METARRLAEAVLRNAYDFEYARNYSGEHTYCTYCKASTPGLGVVDVEHDSECPVLLAEKTLQYSE